MSSNWSVRSWKNVDNAVVYSDIDGIVKSINSDSSGSGDSYNYGSSGSNAFMTILATGDYRIKEPAMK